MALMALLCRTGASVKRPAYAHAKEREESLTWHECGSGRHVAMAWE